MSGIKYSGKTLTTRTLGRMLRDFREARGEKLRTTAAAADMDPSLLSKIELGQRFPTLEQNAALSRHFGIPPAQLEGAQMAEEILKKFAANPQAATLAMTLIRESAGEYRVSKESTAADKPNSATSKPRERN
jgi:transcriptional regulator with XRE-family HTH domain